MLRLHFAIAAIVVAGTASSVFALPFHVSGSEAAEASISSGYFGRLPGSSVRLRVFDAPELAVIIQEDDPHKHIHDSGSDEHHPYSLTEVEVEDSFQMVSMPYAHHEDEISDSSLPMPISEYRERDVRLLFSRGHDEAVNSEEASGETAHKAAKRTHEDDQLPKLQTKLDACVKKLAEIQEQFKECQNILVECQRELSEYTAASKGGH